MPPATLLQIRVKASQKSEEIRRKLLKEKILQ